MKTLGRLRSAATHRSLHLRQSSQVDLVAAAQGQVDQAPQLSEHLEAVGHQQRAVAATQQTLNKSARVLSNAREEHALTLDLGSEGLDTSSPAPSHL